jgi:alkylation response protein AidB-like acyl-CoA dehydrogenase
MPSARLGFVDFDLSDDQLALRDAAHDLLDGYASPARVRAHTEGPDLFDRELWTAMVDQGWLGVELPEESGGLGLGAVELAVLLEEIGRHVAPVPFRSTALAIGACSRAGRDEAVAALLSGEHIACVAWSRTAESVTASVGTTAEGGAWTLSGRADPVVDAPVADLAIVPAVAPDGAALFAVSLGEQGRPAREPAMDLTRPVGWLHLDATPAERLGGADAVAALLDHGATFTAAEMLGSASRVLEMATEYAKERVQFGRPIGSFQAVKHRCADMLVDVEGMRSTVYWAAWCIGARDPDASLAASTAKTWCSDASKRVMASGLQVHGGIGFTWEHDLHFFLKRAQLDQLAFGDSTYHRERVTALVRPRVEAGRSVV